MAEAISDIHELVAAIDLDNIVVHEERARRVHWTEEQLAEQELPATTSSMGISRDGDAIHFRFRTRFTDADAEYVADYDAVYELPGAPTVEQEILHDFASRVAFMTVYPFLRAAIFGAAARLGLPIPVLGLVRQGEFETGVSMTADQIAAEFLDNRSETVSVSVN